MKNKFYCQNCQSFFEIKGKKIEYQNPVYGHCWRRVANCPDCDTECSEYYQKSSTKKSFNFDNYVNNLKNQGGGCSPGGGCCG